MKQRLDVLLCEQSLAPSREAAKRLIMAGGVYIGGQKYDKAGEMVAADSIIELRGEKERYVSRGGYKLEKALSVFPIALSGAVCMDIGASTGGFSDCMLQNGASRVYAVDVGYGQLAWKLREDSRVINLERTNVRYLTGELVPEPISFVSIDVSFISLTLVLPVAHERLTDGGQAVALIKPQFEAGRERVGKKGVVRERDVHKAVVHKVAAFAQKIGFMVAGLDFSPIKGPQGNIEYLIWLKKGAPDDGAQFIPPDVEELVARSHEALDQSQTKRSDGA